MALPTLPEESVRVRERYRRIKRLVTFLVAIGLGLQIFGRRLLRDAVPPMDWMGCWVAGTLFHLAACVLYIRVKGRKPWLGVLGVLGVFGVLALVCMENECHRCGRRESKRVGECPSCGAPM